MTSTELMGLLVESPLDRDAYRHRAELLEIADKVNLEERSDYPGGPSDSRSRREYVYLMIDSAAEKGYTISHLEAIELMEVAVQKRYANEVRESNERDGTWDVNDGIN